MPITEQIGLRTVPHGTPTNLGPFPHPTVYGEATDDRVFIPQRDYRIKIPESFYSAHAPDQGQIIRQYELMADNIFGQVTAAGVGTWSGRHSYVSKRRYWLFVQQLLGYPYIYNGVLQRHLPEPLQWGGTENAVGNDPPFYPHDNNPSGSWQWADNRGAVKFYGNVTAGSNVILGATASAAEMAMLVGKTIEGRGIPEGTTVTAVVPISNVDPSPFNFIPSHLTVVLSLQMSNSATISGTRVQLWGGIEPVRRFAYWATKILRVQGVAEQSQCSHAGDRWYGIYIIGNTTNLSTSISAYKIQEDDPHPSATNSSGTKLVVGMSIMAINPSTGASLFPSGTTVSDVDSTTITASAAATATVSNAIIGISGGIGMDGTGVLTSTIGHPIDEAYKRIRFTVLFERTPYEQLLIGDAAYGGEYSRYTIYNEQPKSRFLQVRGMAQWDVDPTHFGQPSVANMVSGKVFATQEGLPQLIGENMIVWKWIDVPQQAYDWQKIQSRFGTINSTIFPPKSTVSPFYVFGKETALFVTAERVQKTTEAGYPAWDLTFFFHHSPASDGKGYWNRLLNNNNFFQRYFANSSNSEYYKTSDFADLFLP